MHRKKTLHSQRYRCMFGQNQKKLRNTMKLLNSKPKYILTVSLLWSGSRWHPEKDSVNNAPVEASKKYLGRLRVPLHTYEMLKETYDEEDRRKARS